MVNPPIQSSNTLVTALNKDQVMILFAFMTEWKFYMNIAGSELPLLTVEKLGQRLKENIVESFPLPNKNRLVDAHALYRLELQRKP